MPSGISLVLPQYLGFTNQCDNFDRRPHDSLDWISLIVNSLGPNWQSCNTLRWHHNGRDSVSNHQPHDCLLNRLFRRRSTKTSKLRVIGLCVGNSPGKMFPFDDVTMSWGNSNYGAEQMKTGHRLDQLWWSRKHHVTTRGKYFKTTCHVEVMLG